MLLNITCISLAEYGIKHGERVWLRFLQVVLGCLYTQRHVESKKEDIVMRSNKGFTLVELIIVIIILGILALLAIPMFTDTSGTAKQSAYKTNLTVMQSSTQLYYYEHGNVWPGMNEAGSSFGAAKSADAFTNQMTKYTNAAGGVSEDLDKTNYPFGPYFREVPSNPMATGVSAANQALVAIVDEPTSITVGDGTDVGWIFNIQTGSVIGNTD